MGIDVYMKWRDQSEAEAKNQITGFSTVSGHKGYLREAYHGGPYATQVLMPEGWEDHKIKYKEDYRYWFDEKSGEWIEGDWPGVQIDALVLEKRLAKTLNTVLERQRRVYDYDDANDDHRKYVAEVQQSFRDFVALARQKQDETGEPVYIYVSY